MSTVIHGTAKEHRCRSELPSAFSYGLGSIMRCSCGKIYSRINFFWSPDWEPRSEAWLQRWEKKQAKKRGIV